MRRQSDLNKHGHPPWEIVGWEKGLYLLQDFKTEAFLGINFFSSPRLNRRKKIEILRLIETAPDLLAALKHADEFITNGIDLGYIRMPDAKTPDPAHDTPGVVRAAIAKAEAQI